MERTYIKEAFNKRGKVEIYGWVHDIRDLSKVRFLVLKDISGRIQCVGLKGKTDEKNGSNAFRISFYECVCYFRSGTAA